MKGKLISVEEIKREIENLTNKGKFKKITDYLNTYEENYEMLGSKIEQVYELDFKKGMLVLKKAIEEDQSITYTRDWNWYYNTDNIANNDAVIEVRDYIEKNRQNEYESLYFFNLVFKQIDEMKDSLDRPIDFINELKELELSEIQKHILFGMLLFWHGGYPVNNLDKKYNTVLRLVEKEFLSYPDYTIEKEFCAVNKETQKQFTELASHIQAVNKDIKVSSTNTPKMENKLQIPGSTYLSKVDIDFGDLPRYVIQDGIVRRFEGEMIAKDDEYYEWQTNLAQYLNSIPNDHRMNALKKGIEYGQLVYKYHLEKECTNPDRCRLNQSWERRIVLAESILNRANSEIEKQQVQESQNIEKGNKEFTTARQVLALDFIFELLQVKKTEVDRSSKARFVEFLTGKNYKNIYDALENPFVTKEKKFRFEDLKFIRNYFESLGLSEIVKAINNQLEKPK